MLAQSMNFTKQYFWKPLLSGIVVCLGISLLAAGTQVAFKRGFGARDILPFLVWTLPFAGIIALIKVKLINSLRRLSILLRYIVTGLIGIAGGVLWTYVVALFLGPWFGAFSFSVLPCWIIGGAIGMMVGGIGSYEGTKQSALFDLVFVVVICLIAFVVSKPAVVFLSGEQELEVISVKLQPDPEPLINPEVVGKRLSHQDIEQLKAIGLTGQVTYAGSGTFGEGQHARVLIVMQHPVTEPVNLPQPDGAEAIYVQNENRWKIYPPHVPTLQRGIRLWADPRDPKGATRYSVERADGSQQGGTLITW